jgi:hypothetical protein
MKKAMAKSKPYRLFEPVSTEKLGLWSRHLGQYDQIIGYSSLGHFFLRNENSNEYAVLHPFKVATKSYQEYKSVGEFEDSVLKEASFSEYVLRSEQIDLLDEEFGPLENDEVYIPQPIPLPGGPDNPQTFIRGDVWEFMEVVGQIYMFAFDETQNRMKNQKI